MGRGIVDPVDDFRDSNPPSNAPLLDELARQFVQHGDSAKWVIRTIMQSRVYQLSSRKNDFNKDDEIYFSHANTRMLTAEQLLDAICAVTGVPEPYAGLPRGTRAVDLPDPPTDNYFLKIFGQPQREMACQCERSTESNLSQALQMINGPVVHNKLRDDSGPHPADAQGQEDRRRHHPIALPDGPFPSAGRRGDCRLEGPHRPLLRPPPGARGHRLGDPQLQGIPVPAFAPRSLQTQRSRGGNHREIRDFRRLTEALAARTAGKNGDPGTIAAAFFWPLQGRERRVSATSHPERAPVAKARRSGNRSVPASDRHLPSPNGAQSYSPGRSAAQARDPGPPMAHTVDLSEAPTGRDNGRPEFDNPAATDALALSRPVRAFVDSRLRQPRATLRCAPGLRIPPRLGLKTPDWSLKQLGAG